jgi:hypothetical protein
VQAQSEARTNKGFQRDWVVLAQMPEPLPSAKYLGPGKKMTCVVGMDEVAQVQPASRMRKLMCKTQTMGPVCGRGEGVWLKR